MGMKHIAWEIQSIKMYHIWGEKVKKKKQLIRIPKSLTHYIPEGNPLLRKIAFSPVIQQ